MALLSRPPAAQQASARQHDHPAWSVASALDSGGSHPGFMRSAGGQAVQPGNTAFVGLRDFSTFRAPGVALRRLCQCGRDGGRTIPRFAAVEPTLPAVHLHQQGRSGPHQAQGVNHLNKASDG